MKIAQIIEDISLKLKVFAHIAIGLEDADFWLVRRGTPDTVGMPTKTFNKEAIGIKVIQTEILNPDYLFYMMQYIHSSGRWKALAHGATRLVGINVSDVANISLGLRESITEARAKPDLYYHGTSSRFLPSIRAHGLIPSPTERVYDEEHGLASYPGVYLAGSDEDAQTAAARAVEVFGGKETIIGVLVHRHKAFIDEDRIWDFFSNYFDYDIKTYFKTTPSRFFAKYMKNQTFRKQVIAKMYDDFISSFSKIPLELFEEVLDAIIITYVTNPRDQYRIGMGTVTQSYGPRFREIMHQVINSISGDVPMLELGQDTIRVLQPIGFKGIPRIIWIVVDGQAVLGNPPRYVLN